MATSEGELRARRNRSRVAATLCWAGAGAGIAFLVATVISGRLTIINLLVFSLVIISLGAFGILALSGDLVWREAALDEGQLAASRGAQSLAFYVGYLGVIGLWMSYLFMPAWASQVTVHLGVLALLITGMWFGAWTWQRWHG